jgi:hypothetical protein
MFLDNDEHGFNADNEEDNWISSDSEPEDEHGHEFITTFVSAVPGTANDSKDGILILLLSKEYLKSTRVKRLLRKRNGEN